MTGPTPMRDIRLVAADLDGTLLDVEGLVTERVSRAVATARSAGVEVAFLTGRPLDDARAVLGGGGLTGFLAASNGAVVCGRDGAVLCRHVFAGGFGLGLVGELRRLGLVLGAVTESDLVLDSGFPADLAAEWCVVEYDRTVEDLVRGGGVLKLLAARTGQRAGELAEAVRGVARDVTVTYSTHRFLEISPLAADKGAALRVIADAAGVALREIACVGDMPNDLVMFATGGLAVAMGNADDQVRAAAHLVVAGNDAGGVAELLERIVDARMAEVR
ncbi:HAD family hydrolase [Lentzea sp. BCCO 10_0856]|uniref:HAD family hydrolase n=1 Tax=Lentzea miocenica TaxID=3095431 RepID=A0ABU4SYT3_9PSEU|nr:HAD family hydrolase [Lentzea sp. BCCO 10_0856]MDX8031033.1 HAD family hydrolase [Lentzea sp. BCCO 10_0856]